MAKSITSGGGQILHKGNKGHSQLRPVRKDGWTAKKRAEFLDHIAATCNVAASARHVGMGEKGAYRLRRTDPIFAEMWKQALDAGFDRLQAMLMARAMGPMIVEIGDEPMADISAMDTDLALRLLDHHRRVVAGVPRRRGGPVPTRATEEETNASLIKRLKILHLRHQKEAADAKASQDQSENEQIGNNGAPGDQHSGEGRSGEERSGEGRSGEGRAG